MKILYKIWILLLGSYTLNAAPWNLDPPSQALLHAQIEAKHQERGERCRSQGISYFADHCQSGALNFPGSACPDCQNGDPGKEVEDRLIEAHFQKIKTGPILQGHCFGASVIFAQYILLTHPLSPSDSCAQILSEISNRPDFMHRVHAYSVNQPYNYLEPFASLPSGKTENFMHLNPAAMRDFLSLLVEHPVEDYYFLHHSQADPSQFDSVAIYATLRALPHKVSLISYTNKEGFHHCIAVYTHPQKLLVFDSNQGLYQFSDLETLSWVFGRFLQGSKFRWIASFSPTADPQLLTGQISLEQM